MSKEITAKSAIDPERYPDTVSPPAADPLAESQRAIDSLAPAAIAALGDILSTGNDKARLEAAKTILDRAGLSARPRAAEKQAAKDLSALTLEEIEALLHQAEAKRAAVAKPVNASELARKEQQLADMIG